MELKKICFCFTLTFYLSSIQSPNFVSLETKKEMTKGIKLAQALSVKHFSNILS